ncbi:MAG: hypothetical protein PHI36_00600 [Bacteroidales bacterium]|nr:hypothetical protein [Bacteroidales bacterium]
MKKTTLFIFLISCIGLMHAQPTLGLLDKTAIFHFYGGTLVPGEEFGSKDADGLFAKNGFQLGFDVNYIIYKGIGVGFNYEYNNLAFNKEAFLSQSMPDRYLIKGRYNSGKLGLNIQLNLPIVIQPEKITVNLFAEGNAGVRSMNIPSIDLEYNELSNRYVEVTYRPRTNSMGYLGYSGGLQLIFKEKFGINVSYSALMKSRHSIKYSIRKFDAQNNLEEHEGYVNNYLDCSGLQIGLVFYLSTK